MQQSHLYINQYGWIQKLIPFRVKHLPMFLLLMIAFLTNAQAQTTVFGVVLDPEFHAGIPGAVVTDDYNDVQTLTNASGLFQLKVPTNTTITLTITHIGFQTVSLPVFTAGRTIDIGVIELKPTDLNILEIYKLSNRASWKYPVTRSELETGDLSTTRGLMQLPVSLQNIAGIYTSPMGNQFGRSRVNIRGFDQGQTSVMVNGVLLNDPGNNNFNWAGRDGLQEMASSIQVQKGTNSALQYAPFGGGSLNILTKPASHQAGGKVGFEYGAGNYMHSSVTLHSGLLNEKLAVTLSGVRKTSDGIINGTWAEAWAYYLSMTYAPSKKHRIELYAMGAPQRHGQALNMQHVAAYSHQFATKLGVPKPVLDAIRQSSDGRYYNQEFNYLDPAYTGQQYWNGNIHERYAPDFLNEHEHYSHAPLAQINWYADWSPKISQQTMFYYSGLMEGNTGVYGDVNLDYTGPSAFIDYSSTIAENQFKTASEGILSNTVHNQLSLGAMSQLKFQFTEQLNGTLGFNLNSSSIDQYQEVRDLLGGSYFIFDGNPFEDRNDHEKQLGEMIGYHATSQFSRVDFFGNIAFAGEKLGAFLNGAYSLADFTYTDHMQQDPEKPWKEYMLTPEIAPGYQIKSGLSYLLFDRLLLYGNYSYISREADSRMMTNLLQYSNTESPENLVFRGFDAGIRFFVNPSTHIAVSYYDYYMVNNSMSQRFTDQLSNTYMLHILQLDQHHSGFEFEAGYKPVRFVGIEANAALGTWVYNDDATGTLVAIETPGTTTEYTFQNKNLKVGNAPQLQLGTTLSVYPFLNSYVQASFRYLADQFAAWNPAGDLNSVTEQSWETPEYYLIDLHAGFTILTNSRFQISLKGHIFNLLDELFIQDALNNGAVKQLPGDSGEYLNSAAAATVYLGLPRTYSVGMHISF